MAALSSTPSLTAPGRLAHTPSQPPVPRSFTTGELAKAVGGELHGPADIRITHLSSLELGDRESMTFIRSSKFAAKWTSSKAAAALISKSIPLPPSDNSSRALIVVPDADEAMICILSIFETPAHTPGSGVHRTAVVDPTAVVPPTARIGPNCVIGPGCQLGDHVTLHANVTLGANVEIGPASVLHPGVVIYDRCRIGAKSILHANVVVGADGFGYRPDPQGRGLLKIPHIGSVEIGSMVEIGAGTCIDRGKFGATTVGDGTKIDNLVQIGHNCHIGRACIICGLSGLAGSVTIGDGSIIAGKAGVMDNVTIGKRVTITALSGIMSDVPDGTVYSGYPGQPHRDFMRMQVVMKRLAEHKVSPRAIDRVVSAASAANSANSASSPCTDRSCQTPADHRTAG